jgi:hypothetical protein
VKWRQIDHIILATALLLLLLSLVWWPIRMLYADSAYMSWRVMQWEQMDAGRWRWLSYITQIFPWLAVKAQAPTAVVLAIYSLALQLPHSLISYIAWRKAASGTALASVLLSAVWMNSAWFIPVSEMHLAAAVLMLWSLFPRHGWLTALAWFTHPGIGPILLVMIVLPGLSSRRWTALFWLLPAIVLKQWFGDAYEQGFAAGLLKWSKWSESYVFAYLRRVWSQPEWLLSLAFLPISWLLLKRRHAMLHLSACAALLALLALIYRNGDSDVWMQKNLLPLAMAMAFPVWAWMDAKRKVERPDKVALAVLPLLPIMAFSLWQGQQNALQRLKHLEVYTESCSGSGKCLVKEDETLHRELGAVWALPYESLLLSSWKTPETQKTLLPFQTTPPSEALRPDLFIGAPFTPPVSLRLLNQAYFQLPLQKYQITDSGKILR